MEKFNFSTMTRKPWGGQLQASQAEPPESMDPDFIDWLGLALRKFAEISLLAALVAVPLMYHFSLDADVAERLRSRFNDSWQEFFGDQVLPYISGGLPVIESKFSAWLILGLAMMGSYVGARLLEGIFRRRFFARPPHVAQESRRSTHRLVPLLVAAGFLVFGLCSFMFWPPPMPTEAREMSGVVASVVKGSPNAEGTSVFAKLGGGGFFFSMVSWLQLAFALFFFIICEDLIRERPFVNKILGIIVMVGFVNALVVVLLKLDFDPLRSIWVRFSAEEFRNNLGAFIGHNTGASSFLMAPLLITLTWLFGIQRDKSPQVRVLLCIALLIMLLAVLLAQSRAIIPILIIAIPGMLFLMARRSALLPKSRIYILLPVALVLVTLTQIIPSRFNVLYRQDVTLVQRVAEFRPHRLLTETRLRILAVCMYRLVPERPLIGHGFGSFQYVYPKEQGRYFAEHPRSRLAPTHLRTPQAHNEYLQILVETGLIGLAAVGVGLFFLLRGGWKAFLRTLMPYHAATQAGIFVSIIALLLHCFVDFPMRVPPIALTLIVLLAIWSAGDRLWLFSLKPLPSDDASLEREDYIVTAPAPPPFWKRAVAYSQSTFMAIFLLGAAGWIAVLSAVPFQAASTLHLRAESLLSFYRQTTAPHLLDQAETDLWQARRIYWISGAINRTHGYMKYLQAYRRYLFADSLREEGRADVADKMEAVAESLASAALSDINMALTDEHFHSLYQLRASVYELLATHNTSDRRDAFRSQMMEDLYRAVHMNPGDPNTLLLLIRRLESRPVIDNDQVVHYLRTLSYFHPQFFRENVYARALDALGMMEIGESYRQMKLINAAAPEADDLLIAFAAVALQAGEAEKARLIVDEFLKRKPIRQNRDFLQAAEVIQVLVAIDSSNDEWALKRLQVLDVDNAPGRPMLIALQYFLSKRMGLGETEATRLRQRLIAEGQRNPQHFQAIGDTAMRYFHDYAEAVEWLQRRREVERPLPMDLQGHVLLAKALGELGRWDEVLELAEHIESMEAPAYPRQVALLVVRELRSRAAAATNEAAAP